MTFNKRLGSLIGRFFEMPYVSYCQTLAASERKNPGKMSAIDESNVSLFISKELKVNFDNSKFNLNGWGQVDNWCKMENNCYLFLEVETSKNTPIQMF